MTEDTKQTIGNLTRHINRARLAVVELRTLGVPEYRLRLVNEYIDQWVETRWHLKAQTKRGKP